MIACKDRLRVVEDLTMFCLVPEADDEPAKMKR